MAMKYGKYLTIFRLTTIGYVVNNIINRSVIAVFSTVLVCSCQTNTKNDIAEHAVSTSELRLLSTAEYIPKLPFDDGGKPLPYQAQPSPYSALTGRIDKESILSFIEAKRALTAKQYDRSVRILEGLSKKEPALSGPLLILGDIATQQNDLDKAITYYKKTIEINALNINAYLKLALSQRQLGKFLESQNTYTNALKQWKDFPEAHLNLGILYDIYLNHPIRAQRHLEAYQFLTNGEDKEVSQWLDDLQKRTGIAIDLVLSHNEIALKTP